MVDMEFNKIRITECEVWYVVDGSLYLSNDEEVEEEDIIRFPIIIVKNATFIPKKGNIVSIDKLCEVSLSKEKKIEIFGKHYEESTDTIDLGGSYTAVVDTHFTFEKTDEGIKEVVIVMVADTDNYGDYKDGEF